MIEISYNSKELKNEIRNIAEGYETICLIEAIGEISKEMLDFIVEVTEENSEPKKKIDYVVSIGGEAIECNYINTSRVSRTVSGEGYVGTPDGTYRIGVTILIKLDSHGHDAHIKKVSLDAFNCTDPGDVKVNYSIEKDLLGGISVYADGFETGLQKIINDAWEDIRKRVA